MKKYKISVENKWDKMILFLLVFVPRVILILCFAGVFRTPMDEMSTIATGAFFGGKDWTALTTHARFYYGGGFTILFAPLFRLIDNSRIVYYFMLIVCAVLQSISAPISYHIMDKFMKIKDRKYLWIGSLACSFMVVTRAMEVYNEHIIIGCVWISVWLICKLIEDDQKKPLYSIALMLLFSYMLTTHTRTKVIWIAFAIVLIIYRVLYKKWLVTLIPALITGGIGYWAAGKFNDFVKKIIWDWQEGTYLRNASVNINISLSDLKDPVYWQGIFSVIFGQINTVIVFTGGIIVIFMIALLYFYKDVVTERFLVKKGNAEGSNLAGAGPYILTISILFILCAGAVCAAQSITWLSGLADALKNATYGTNEYDYKAVTYVRYMGPFLGPLFLCGLTVLYHKKEEIRSYLLPSFITLGVFQMVWVGFILPHIYKCRPAAEVFTAFAGYNIVYSTEPLGVKVYLMGSVILLIVFCGCCIFCFKKNLLAVLTIVLCLFVYEYGYGAIAWDGAYVKSYGSYVNSGVDVIQSLEEDGIYGDQLPDTIYVVDKMKTSRMYTYQMYLSDYSIIFGRPKDEEKHIVFSSIEEDQKLLNRGYYAGVLDDNEYVYVNSPEYLEMFEAQGIVFSDK